MILQALVYSMVSMTLCVLADFGFWWKIQRQRQDPIAFSYHFGHGMLLIMIPILLMVFAGSILLLTFRPIDEWGPSEFGNSGFMFCFLLIWMIGMAISFFRQRKEFSVYRVSLQNSFPGDHVMEQRVLDMTKELDIRQKVQVRVSYSFTTPFVVGVVRPVIILPRMDYTEAELNSILVHELFHVKNHDLAFLATLYYLTGVFWFLMPLWKAYMTAFTEKQEEYTDYCVWKLTGHGGKMSFSLQDYEGTLLRCAVDGQTIDSSMQIGISGNSCRLQTRIEKLQQYQQTAPVDSRGLVIGLLVGVLISSVILELCTGGCIEAFIRYQMMLRIWFG